MSKLSQVLMLDPAHELRFVGPFNNDVQSHLELSNPTERPVAFKVKTTAPKRYCVRPNSGIIQPNQNMKLVVILRSFDHEHSTEQMKDKFMVQSMFCDEGAIWNEGLFKEASPEQLMDSKIRCVFDYPAGKSRSSDEKVDEATHVPGKSPMLGKEAVGSDSDAIDMIKQLREENSRLLREKLELQDESAKLRKRITASQTSGEGAGGQMKQFAADNKPPGVNLTMEVLAVAFIVTFFVALFIGKVVL